MQYSQQVIWTALPKAARTALGSPVFELSVHVSPRLQIIGDGVNEPLAGEGTLSQFPDFSSPGMGWAARMADMQFRVEMQLESATLAGTGKTTWTVSADEAQMDASMWDQLFPGTTRVLGYTRDSLADRVTRSYLTRPVAEMVKQQYQSVGKAPSLMGRQPTVLQIAQATGATNPLLAGFAATSIQAAQSRAAGDTPERAGASGTTYPAVIPQVEYASIVAKPITEVARAHRALAPSVVPVAAAAQLPKFDFHMALSGLQNFPVLKRKLGLILELTLGSDSKITTGAAIPTSGVARGRIRVVPIWPDGSDDSSHGGHHPWTRFTINWPGTDKFLTAPGTTDRKVQDGMLLMRGASSTAPDPVTSHAFDVDEAFQKLSALARDVIVPMPAALNAGEPGARVASLLPGQIEMRAVKTSAALPVLRSAGPSLHLANAERIFKQQQIRVSDLNDALDSQSAEEIELTAEDVIQGWAIDVWDSKTQKWHQLCRRSVEFYGGPEKQYLFTHEDTGWVEDHVVLDYGNADVDDGSSDVRVREQMFHWEGWSLVAPRPGAAIVEGDPDPTGAPKREWTTNSQTYQLGEYVHPEFPVLARPKAADGTLPRLRFGLTYRFRARGVDLAGNTVRFVETDTRLELPTVSRPMTYRRHEPVPAPVLVPKTPLGPGESVNEIVVRSGSTPGAATAFAERHIVPPRCSEPMAEQHGMMDKTVGTSVVVDPTAWNYIRTHDGDLPTGVAASLTDVPYLPDPLAYGASFRRVEFPTLGLPGQPQVPLGDTAVPGTPITYSAGSTAASNVVTYRVTKVSFPSGAAWYDKKPFVLKVVAVAHVDSRVAGYALPKPPAWDAASRTLTVQLPRGERITFELASYLRSTREMGALELRQWALESIATTATVARTQVDRLGMNGTGWMFTPSQRIVLTHACERPVLVPSFPPAPASRATIPPGMLSLARQRRETFVELTGAMPVHGASTGRLEVFGSWTEYLDDPAWGQPRMEQRVNQLAFGLEVPSNASTMLNSTLSAAKAARRHHFGDTKHRLVTYRASATSRYRDYFTTTPDDDASRFSMAGRAHWPIHVLASERPAPPDIAYCVPSFLTKAGATSRARMGAVRVYLNRPWYSSGQDEQLGVMFWTPVFDALRRPKGRDAVAQWVSDWGPDPIWESDALPKSYLDATCFREQASIQTSVFPAERENFIPAFKGPCSVACYEVKYDEELKLWFADIRLTLSAAYTPFIRLALCRWQPYALPRLSNSNVVLCDFIQQLPDRTLVLTYADAARTKATITLDGPSYTKGNAVWSTAERKRQVVAVFERRSLDSDLDWVPVGSTVTLAKPAILPSGASAFFVQAKVTLPTRESGYEYRLAIKELEWHAVAETPIYNPLDGWHGTGSRLVYAETVPLWNGDRLP